MNISEKLKRGRRFYARFKDNIWAGDLVETGSLDLVEIGINLLDIYYVWKMFLPNIHG